MKTCLSTVGFFVASVVIAAAQSNLPAVRLAIVAENPATRAAADVLTAQLTTNPSLALLERNEAEKIYQEQRLTADNRNYKKLGELLGADGLLMLDTTTEGTNQFLKAQLVAVKPGVIVGETRSGWPLPDVTRWATLAARRFEPLFPKLDVLEKDALPVSVVNLRAALKSDDEQGLESSLTLMLISRLTHERDLFVLERRRLDALDTEKSLNGTEDSPFWNGAWLVDGIVDRDGFSKDTVTISGRLIPSKGGAPVALEASGPRANPAAVIDELANKIVSALKIVPVGSAWQASDEAARYFQEAQWEFSWGMFEEARADADSAWALGKHDMDCAILRIRALENPSYEVPVVAIGGYDPEIVNDGTESGRDWLVGNIKQVGADFPGTVFELKNFAIDYLEIRTPPKEEPLNRMLRGLELYREFSLTLPPDGTKMTAAWGRTGIDTLVNTAKILQYYYYFPQQSAEVREKLADLRASARAITAWLSQCIHNIPPMPGNIRNQPDYYNAQLKSLGLANLFGTEATFGSYWQETPEDCVVMYRTLLNESNFTLSADAKKADPNRPWGDWHEELSWPWLTGWIEADRKRMPTAWKSFKQELADSTNRTFQTAGKSLAETPVGALNSQEMVEQYLQYWHELGGRDWDAIAFDTARKVLSDTNFLEQPDLNTLFQRDFAQSEAAVLQPLLTVYQSNYSARFGNAYDPDGSIVTRLATLRDLQARLAEALHQNQIQSPPPPRAPPETLATNDWLPTVKPLLVNHFIRLPIQLIPKLTNFNEQDGRWNEHFEGYSWDAGKLAMDFRYTSMMYGNESGGTIERPVTAIFDGTTEAWSFFPLPYKLADGGFPQWSIGPYETLSHVSFKGDVYYAKDDVAFQSGQKIGSADIMKLSSIKGTWETLTPPGLDRSQLFSADGRLFATSEENILELTNGGKDVRVLASTRRRPPATTLDSSNRLGVNAPWIIAGPDHTLNAVIAEPEKPSAFYTLPGPSWIQLCEARVFAWESNDWREAFDLHNVVDTQAYEGLVIFRSRDLLWCWGPGQTKPELCLDEQRTPSPVDKTIWKANTNLLLATAPMTCFRTNLYFFIEHNTPAAVDPHLTAAEKNDEEGAEMGALDHARRSWSVAEKDDHHALLVCLERDCPDPIIVPLKFDLNQGPPPLAPGGLKGADSSVRLFIGNNHLYICEPSCLGIWIMPMAEVDAAVTQQKLSLGKNSERAEISK